MPPLIYIPPRKISAPTSPPDPGWTNVALLMHGDGVQGSTTFTDETGLSYTSSGAIVDGGAGIGGPKFGTGCIKPNGQIIGTANSTRFDISNQDFCMEFFLYRTGSLGGGSQPLYVKDDGGANRSYAIYGNVDRYFFQYFPGGGAFYSPVISANQWHHIALVRYGSVLTWYLDGVASTTLTYGTGAFTTVTTPFKVCTSAANSYYDEMRITVGLPRYTANFSVPTAPFSNS